MNIRLVIYSIIFSSVLLIVSVFMLVHTKIAIEQGRVTHIDDFVIPTVAIITAACILLNLFLKNRVLKYLCSLLVFTCSVTLLITVIMIQTTPFSFNAEIAYLIILFMLSIVLIHAILKN
jgi:hypothetical protein